MKRILPLALSIIFTMVLIFTFMLPAQKTEAASEDYTQYVDPFVGTDVDYGQLFPGAVVPYGLVKLSPDTYPHHNNDHAGYDYSKDRIAGFSHTRIEGVGGQGAGGDILVTPSYMAYSSRPSAESRGQKYSKSGEYAEPGYYKVELTPRTGSGNGSDASSSFGKIKAEITTDTRTGYHRYTLPQSSDNFALVVDLNYTYHGTDVRNAILNVETSSKTTSLSGRFSGKNVSGHGRYTLYYYIETSKPVKSYKTWNGNSLGNSKAQAGNDIGAILYFDVNKNDVIEMKVSISPISPEQAKIDMYNEVPHWDFNKVRINAKNKWNEVLSKVKVENSAKSDPDGRLKKLFYTHLYHMFTTPVNATSTSNTFRATNTKVYEANDYIHYDSWTLWDDFRKYPMIGLVLPDVYKDIIRSLANTMTYGIGTWGIDTQTVPTVRTEHAVALLADGIAKGFTDIDNLLPAYEKAKQIANSTVTSSVEERGYITGRVDKTVEFAYDDWAISIIADYLGKTSDYNRYLKRSFNYANLFRPNAVGNMGLLWPKDNNGAWMKAEPEKYGDNGLYQGTLWQYTWWDSNDVKGLMDLMGGKGKMLQALSYLYGEHEPNNGKRMLHTNTNEIDLHTPYLFNFAGKPSRTQYWVRHIYSKKTWNRYSGTGEYNPPIYDYVYKLDPKGFLETMDDDAGTMAAMYVAAAMGIFPMTPGDTTFQIGSPFFEKVTLDVGGGKTFVIKANNVSPDNYYIQSAKLNGKNFNRTWIDYSEIIRGGVLEFQMGSSPSTWAENGVLAPSSSETAESSYIDKNDSIVYSTSVFAEASSNNGSISNEILITVKNTTFTGSNGSNLISANKVAVSNVPSGLSAEATKVNNNTIRIALKGNANKHNRSDSIGNLTISLNDNLFANPNIQTKKKVRNDIKVMFDDPRLDFSRTVLRESSNDDGVISDTAKITLTGDAKFAGSNNENFVSTGKIKVYNVPSGLTARIVRNSDTQLTLSFAGKANNHDYDTDDVIISFQNSAFNGVSAADIDNSNFGGMNGLILDFIEPANVYAPSYGKFEAEHFDSWSMGGLKVEDSVDSTGATITNIGGTYDGAWICYEQVDFAGNGLDKITVRYSNNGNRCGANARLEIRLGSIDGNLIGTIPLDVTSEKSWNVYTTKTISVSKSVIGRYDVYIVMRAETSASNPYVGNFDWFDFTGKPWTPPTPDSSESPGKTPGTSSGNQTPPAGSTPPGGSSNGETSYEPGPTGINETPSGSTSEPGDDPGDSHQPSDSSHGPSSQDPSQNGQTGDETTLPGASTSNVFFNVVLAIFIGLVAAAVIVAGILFVSSKRKV